MAGFAEADAADLSVGQPATLTFPALTNTEVAGKVIAVSNSSTVVNNVVTYDATIALVNPPADVKQGMTTNVSVATSTQIARARAPDGGDHDERDDLHRAGAARRRDDRDEGDHRARRQLDDGDRERAARRRRRRRADGDDHRELDEHDDRRRGGRFGGGGPGGLAAAAFGFPGG